MSQLLSTVQNIVLPMNSRTGLTLLEVMVAVVLTSGILLGGRILLEQMSDARRVLAEQSAKIERTIYGEQLLKELVRNIDNSKSDSLAFVGDEHQVEFTTWCDSASGLRGQCTAHVTIDSVLSVSLSIDSRSPLIIRSDSVRGILRYLTDPANGGRWIREWRSEIMLPLALGVIIGIDTTVLRIGDRG